MKPRILIGLLVILVIIVGAAAVAVHRGGGGQSVAQADGTQTDGAQAGSTGGTSGGTGDVQTGRFQKLSPSPDLAGIVITGAEGEDIDLARYKGKALLINVWATWCAPCVAEMPSLNRLEAKLGGDKFAVVPIAVDEQSLDKVKAFIADHQLDKLPVLLDVNRAVDKVVRITVLPTSLLVSPEGKIVARFTGDNKWDCGKAFSAVESFVKTGDVNGDMLEPCAD